MNTVVAVLSGYTATKVSPPFLYGFYFIFILAYFVLILALGLILTNRIAGPLYRMKKHLEAVGRGETLSDISFRKNDYFGEVLAPYNQVIKMLRDLQEEKNGRSKES
jgi:nitrogen fixation/metabolism regulation signal transduction histidine kinase